MFGLGAPELIIILVIVLVVFGAGKLPQVLGSLGKGVREFRDASEGRDAETNPPQTPANPQAPNPNPYLNNPPNTNYPNPTNATPNPYASSPGPIPGQAPTDPLFDAAPNISGQPNTYVTPPAAKPTPQQAAPGESTEPRS